MVRSGGDMLANVILVVAGRLLQLPFLPPMVEKERERELSEEWQEREGTIDFYGHHVLAGHVVPAMQCYTE